MDFNFLTIVFLLLSIVALVAAAYSTIQYKSKKQEGVSLEGKLKRLKLDVNTTQKSLSDITSQYEEKKSSLSHLLGLEKREAELANSVKEKESSLEKLRNKHKEKASEHDHLEQKILDIKNDISIFEPSLDLINVGYFEEPEYLFETSDRFKEEIKIIREKQKALIKEKQALEMPEAVAVTSNSTYARKILKGQTELMLKAFNIECDKLIGQIKPSNFAQTLERIEKTADNIEKLSLSLECGFNKEYVKLKFEECELQYQFKLKEAREREEQQIIKEQMREEQKALREYERAIAKADKEEKMYQNALAEAQKALSIAGEEEKHKLEGKISFLQQQLEEAIENGKRAKSMAEQTRRGYVYVISNVGSFGEDVYKIGLTRRLEPLDRVKELGDASVPFSFDVHAMIFSEDAPKLERDLHEAFMHHRVNVVNSRKEFFIVPLEEIREKAEEITSGEAEFKMTVIAEEYHESKKLRGPLN